ncbi:MAG: hypothetical protein KC910_13725 [Candidatus Eremiobacteraeota bacterium]|nr:hypothetical protein [Candidatus Eremiobacteraeota bacterium]
MRKLCMILLAGACLAVTGCARSHDVSLDSPRRDTNVEAPYKMYPYSADLAQDKSLTGRTVTPDQAPATAQAELQANPQELTVRRDDFLAALEQTASELHKREDLTKAERRKLDAIDARITQLIELSADLSADLRDLDRATAVR